VSGSLFEVMLGLLVAAVPLGLSLWALLDAAHRPEWAFAFVNRSRTAWVAACAVGILFCGFGIVVALWYLLRVRPQVAGVEAGHFEP
jgi:Protein of unknown function (DUF2516)